MYALNYFTKLLQFVEINSNQGCYKPADTRLTIFKVGRYRCKQGLGYGFAV